MITRQTGTLVPLNEGGEDLENALVENLSNATLEHIWESIEDLQNRAGVGGLSIQCYMDGFSTDHLDGEDYWYDDGILYKVDEYETVIMDDTFDKESSGEIHYQIHFDADTTEAKDVFKKLMESNDE